MDMEAELPKQENTMEQVISEEVQRLARMPIAQLRARYREVYGEESRSGHRQHLVRRIGWRLQVMAQGDLSERAARRALELANDADLKVQAPPAWVPAVKPQARAARRDRRLPPAGSLMRRSYRGADVEVKVWADVFEYEGQRYDSLSAVARKVTGTRWNGLLFFGLTKRRKGKTHGSH
jgi:hypothetical protein